MTRVVTTSRVGNSDESKGLLELQPDDRPWGESKARNEKERCYEKQKESSFQSIKSTLNFISTIQTKYWVRMKEVK